MVSLKFFLIVFQIGNSPQSFKMGRPYTLSCLFRERVCYLLIGLFSLRGFGARTESWLHLDLVSDE